MRFAVVTPVRNGAGLVADTVRSIVNQEAFTSGRHQLDYVVWDAQSTDETVAVAIATGGDRVRVVSRPDNGMYDGLANAFSLVRGDVYFYLNAGDMLLPGAIDAVAHIFSNLEVDWICGLRVKYSREGQLTYAQLPFRFRRKWISSGVYGRYLPHVQQESTFWSRVAMEHVDLEELRKYKLAGDYYLWTKFAELSEPRIVEVGLGGFRSHDNHLSSGKERYAAEVRGAASSRLSLLVTVLALLEVPVWYFPSRVKWMLHRDIVRASEYESLPIPGAIRAS